MKIFLQENQQQVIINQHEHEKKHDIYHYIIQPSDQALFYHSSAIEVMLMEEKIDVIE